jgi:alanyl-tRNA synthetase
MTERLYYTDPLATEFTARIVSTVQSSVDQKPNEVVLDRTLFYPEGGGQPADHGLLGGIPVIDVQKRVDGTIVHTLDRPLPENPGSQESPREIKGEIDWNHRFEYMQQHTGQHVLSSALWEIAGAATVSVAQGSDVTSIEVDTDTLTAKELEAVTNRANELIREDLPVIGFWIDHTELPRYSLRRPTKRTGSIRLVCIGEVSHPVDLVACGGVHLPRTGMLNLILLTGMERIRGHQRLHFKIGGRALTDYRDKHDTLLQAAELFSAHPSDLPDRIDQEQQEMQELKRTARLRAERLARFILEAHRLETLQNGATDSPYALVLDNEDPDIFKALPEIASENPDTRLIVVNPTGDTVHWAIVIGDTHDFPADTLRTKLLKPFGAKGGGKPPLWRGVIPSEPASKTKINVVADRFAATFSKLIG